MKGVAEPAVVTEAVPTTEEMATEKVVLRTRLKR
jgi:hypothetical protein